MRRNGFHVVSRIDCPMAYTRTTDVMVSIVELMPKSVFHMGVYLHESRKMWSIAGKSLLWGGTLA